jgi:hypothetical protein
MTRTRNILAVMESVKLTVRSAALDWDATDVRGIEAAAAGITGSVQPLRAALDKPEICGNFPPNELRKAAQALKKEAATLERLVDAAAAFVRSGPVLYSDGGPAYTFGGGIGSVAARPTESYAG